jgi:hypothetical protein
MSRRRGPVLRGISKHRNYEIAEIARILAVCRATVARWIATGLPAIMDRKPFLILGADLIAFHAERRAPARKCGLTECYCFRCRAVRPMAGDMAEITIGAGPTANLHALCGACCNPMRKRVSLKHLDILRGALDLTIQQAFARIVE